MNKEIIKRLKDKKFVRAFGLMEETLPGSQECFREVGKKNCLFYSLRGWGIADNEYFVNITTYAIRPNYQPEPDACQYCGACRMVRPSGKWQYNCLCDDPGQRPKPEPEFVDLEIVKTGPYYCCLIGEEIGTWEPIHCLPSLPNFKDFWYETEKGNKWYFTNDGLVATYIYEGKTVYARFRK